MAKTEKKDNKKVSRIKVKKKVWYKIISPTIFGNREVGESYLQSPESGLNRVMKVNLKDLSGNIRDQNVYITLKINKVEGTQLKTIVTGYEITASHVRRMIRKRNTRVDDYFVVKTKSGREVIVKPLLMALGKIQKQVGTTLRKQFKEFITEELSKTSFANFIAQVVSARVQVAAKKKLNKVYPIREVSLRVIKLKGESNEEEIVVEDHSASETKKVEQENVETATEEESTEEAAEKEADEEDNSDDESADENKSA